MSTIPTSVTEEQFSEHAENVRNWKKPKRGRKRLFNAGVYKRPLHQ